MPDSETVDAFLRFDVADDKLGKVLVGESIDPQALGWFHITGFSLSLSAPVLKNQSKDSHDTKGHKADKGDKDSKKDRSEADHYFPAVEVDMPMQVGSPILMKLCTEFANAKTEEQQKDLEIKAAEIWIRRAGAPTTATTEGSGQDWFLQVTLGKVTIASYKTGIECKDSFTMSYEDITVTYYRSDPETGLILLKSPQIPGLKDPPYMANVQWFAGAKKPDSN